LEATTTAATLAAPAGRVMRVVLIAAGTVLVGVGVLGIFLPLLPTTVFFLLAAACYARSSPGAYRWLTTNRFFGRYIRHYREEHGATMGAKMFSIGSLWIGISASAFLFEPAYWVDAILLLIAVGVTVHLLTLRTIRPLTPDP